MSLAWWWVAYIAIICQTVKGRNLCIFLIHSITVTETKWQPTPLSTSRAVTQKSVCVLTLSHVAQAYIICRISQIHLYDSFALVEINAVTYFGRNYGCHVNANCCLGKRLYHCVRHQQLKIEIIWLIMEDCFYHKVKNISNLLRF